ncbi:glucuronoxylan 4-O-methyltransferase 1 [Lactuca sativa]|uniref:glucuronoxylan 4-O-methyltransferase 1 n=1 Tax=Lactuca sativa TaxID=4236 RepID=UPI000CD84EEF|nr:glucuronoxylan 4-O-methyltransferase 1 [Lactuca sativa]
MRNKGSKYPIAFKPILLVVFFLLVFVLVILLRSSSLPTSFQAPSVTSDSNLPTTTNPTSCPPLQHQLSASQTCNKLSPATAETLVHYVTSNITPQQTYKEISVSLRVLLKKSPCNFLVFGLGFDSPMWATLNHGGRTVFLEEDKSWIQQIQSKFPTLESYHVVYDTKVARAAELMEIGKREECNVVGDPRVSGCELAMKGNLPEEVYEVEWDLIMVDAPTGYHDEAPGRMKAIYTAGLMARNREEGETDVFVHDVNRVVEDEFSKVFLCEGYLSEEEGRLRRFTIPSHRTRSGRPFCPL